MSRCVIWAIDPNNKPSNAQLREVIAGSDTQRKRKQTYGYATEVIDGIGIIPITDALYTSDYRRFSANIEAMNENPEVQKIVLDINSPGGMVSGAIECAHIISKSKKPVEAYIEGMGCSAAYLLASSASKIIASEPSEIGSIGVQASWTNTEGLLAKLGIQKVYFHSKFSSKKNLSPASKEGAEAIKKNLDETWDLFAGKIAENRNITIDELVEKYGQGEVFLAKEAKERGLIDETASDFSAYMDSIKPQWRGEGASMENQTITTIEALTAAYPQLVAQIQSASKSEGVKEGQTGERARVVALVGLTKYTSDMNLIAEAVKNGKTEQEAVKDILDAQLKEQEQKAKEAKGVLETAARESDTAVVQAATLPSDGTKTDEEAIREKYKQMSENIKGEKK